jgi:acyl carrier protein
MPGVRIPSNMTMQSTAGPDIDPYESLVHDALTRQLGFDPGVLRPEHRLREDLGLDSLDLSLVALRLERKVRRDFPLAVLSLVSSVDQLVRLVRAWAGSVTSR